MSSKQGVRRERRVSGPDRDINKLIRQLKPCRENVLEEQENYSGLLYWLLEAVMNGNSTHNLSSSSQPARYYKRVTIDDKNSVRSSSLINSARERSLSMVYYQ